MFIFVKILLIKIFIIIKKFIFKMRNKNNNIKSKKKIIISKNLATIIQKNNQMKSINTID